jgi:hypothetical protein
VVIFGFPVCQQKRSCHPQRLNFLFQPRHLQLFLSQNFVKMRCPCERLWGGFLTPLPERYCENACLFSGILALKKPHIHLLTSRLENPGPLIGSRPGNKLIFLTRSGSLLRETVPHRHCLTIEFAPALIAEYIRRRSVWSFRTLYEFNGLESADGSESKRTRTQEPILSGCPSRWMNKGTTDSCGRSVISRFSYSFRADAYLELPEDRYHLDVLTAPSLP